MVEIQKQLTIKYRNLFGLSKLIVSNNSPDTIFADKVQNDFSYIVNDCIINNNLSINSSLYLLNNIQCSNMSTVNDIVISTTSLLNNLTLNNLFVTSNSFIKNNITINGDSKHNNITQMGSLNSNNLISNTINTNNIYQNSNVVNINGDVITIGTDKSTINIIGNLSYISTSNLKIADKLITLNDPNKLTNNYYGIEILGTSGNGYIKTLDNGRYEIKAPLDITKKYIVEVDMNENINISGTALLYNNVTVLSNISIAQNVIYNEVVANNLNVSSKTICTNYYSNNMNISGITYISNDMNTEKLIVKNINMINLTVLSVLNIDGTCNIASNVTLNSDLTLNNTLLVKNTMTVLSDLKVNSAIINNNLTVNSNLFVSSNALLNNNLSAASLSILKDTMLNNSLTLTSKLFVSKNINIKGNVTMNNSFITGNIVIPLKHYDTNYTAALNNVQKWGLYRTGGIVKIRLDILPPVITLVGNSTLDMAVGMSYLELGGSALDNDDGNISVYITSIKKANTEYLNNQVLILATSTYISTTTPLNTVGTYTITYNALDSIGNVGIKYRTLNITP